MSGRTPAGIGSTSATKGSAPMPDPPIGSGTADAALAGVNPGASLLLTDLYQLTMLEAYLERGLTEPAVFELFVRTLPERRGFLMAAGLEQALEFLEAAR